MAQTVSRTPEQKQAALTTARILLEINAVNFRPEEPYTLTSGWSSPVYVDCRKVISFPRARSTIIKLMTSAILRDVVHLAQPVRIASDSAHAPSTTDIPRPLAAIIARATAPAPADRYPSASALAADVRRWLDGEKVEAHSESLLERAARLYARNRPLIWLLVTYAVVRATILIWRGV